MRGAFVAGITTAAIAASEGAIAQQASQPQPGASSAPVGAPGSIPLGPLMVYPAVELAIGYSDNLFLTPSAPTSSAFSTVSPNVRIEAKPGAHKFEFALRVSEGTYYSSRADNYTDYSLIGDANMVFSARVGLKLRAEYTHGHDARGSTDAAATATPSQYDNYGIGGVFRYGAEGARGRIEIDAGAFARRYTNNPESTASLDRNTSQAGGSFYWRVLPRIELLTQAGVRRFDYVEPGSTQNSTETQVLVGAKWDATAATSGTLKVGRMRKEFDSSSNPAISGSTWDAGVRWSPLTYSVFDFATSKQTNEATGVGDAIITKFYGVSWSHAWNSRLRTQALASYRDDAFINSVPPRVDNTTSFGLKVNYDFRRWLRLGAEYTHSNRESSIDTFGFKRNLFLFTIRATL